MARKTRQNLIAIPDVLKNVNKSNIRLKDDFLLYLKSVQRSPGTIYNYNSDINIALVWNHLYNGDKDFAKITKRDWATYQNWLVSENGNSPARVRRQKAALSSLSNYISNILDDEPEFENFKPTVKKIENPSLQQVRKKTVWSDEELDALLGRLVEDEQYKKACALALAMCSGRRKSELCRFRVTDFKDGNLVCGGSLYKTTDPIKTKGFGYGKYIFCYTLAKKFKPYFDMWMVDREKKGIESEWLFPKEGSQSEKMHQTTLNSWASTFSSITGKDFYWHSLRHYFTTHLVRAGIPDNVIKLIVGWESTDMCAVYTDIPVEERLDVYFGNEGIKKVKPKSFEEL